MVFGKPAGWVITSELVPLTSTIVIDSSGSRVCPSICVFLALFNTDGEL